MVALIMGGEFFFGVVTNRMEAYAGGKMAKKKKAARNAAAVTRIAEEFIK